MREPKSSQLELLIDGAGGFCSVWVVERDQIRGRSALRKSGIGIDDAFGDGVAVFGPTDDVAVWIRCILVKNLEHA